MCAHARATPILVISSRESRLIAVTAHTFHELRVLICCFRVVLAIHGVDFSFLYIRGDFVLS